MNLKLVAEILERSMCAAGYLDDYDEIILYHIKDDPEEANAIHNGVLEGLRFINTHLQKTYAISNWQSDYEYALINADDDVIIRFDELDG